MNVLLDLWLIFVVVVWQHDVTHAEDCTYSFTVPTKNIAAVCSSNPEPLSLKSPNDAAAPNFVTDTIARKLLLSVTKLLSHQNVLDDVTKAHRIIQELNTTISKQSEQYQELLDKTLTLQSHVNLLTSGLGDGKDRDPHFMAFPNYSGITHRYVGCPVNHPKRIHEITPIKKAFDEVVQLVPRSCYDWKLGGFKEKGQYLIDPDGLEGAEAFNVECMMVTTEPITIIHHTEEDKTHVVGFEEPGSFTVDINYVGATKAQLKALAENSYRCEQYIKWECKGASLTDQGWWVSRDGRQMEYWGDGKERGCACHVEDNCRGGNLCNCDANDDRRWLMDAGTLRDKDTLPVSRLQFGDTGSYQEEAYFTLGPLRCYSNATSPYSTSNAILPVVTWPPSTVFCDYEGWIVIHRRSPDDNSLSFYRTWAEYKAGFGDLHEDFWIGLEKMHQLTNQGQRFALQVIFGARNGLKLHAQYLDFRIANETEKYRLTVGDYSGTMTNELEDLNEMMFTTHDQDNDHWYYGNCAMSGGGWWFSDCGQVNLNGREIVWGSMRDVTSVEMKIKAIY